MIKRTGSVAEVRQQVKEWKKQGTYSRSCADNGISS